MEPRELNPQRYRDEAARTRRLAARTRDQALRQQLLGIACDYDNLATTAELLVEQRRAPPTMR